MLSYSAGGEVLPPLDDDDLRAIYRLRHQLEPDIAVRSCRLLSDADLDALEREAVGFGALDVWVDDIYEAHRAFHLALLQPAATEWDVRILGTLWRAAERYIRIGFGHLVASPSEHGREHAHVELVRAFRSRDGGTVRQAVHDHLEHTMQIALHGLSACPYARLL